MIRTTTEIHSAPPPRCDAAQPAPKPGAVLDPEITYALAKKALDARQYRLAASLLEGYVLSNPEDARGFLNLGFCRVFSGEYEAAVEPFQRAVALRPHHIRSLIMCANVLFAVGRREEAAEFHARALAEEPSTDLERTAAALVSLVHGDFSRGWRDLEARWTNMRIDSVPFRPHERSLWDGRPLPEHTLYVHGEGGYGDVIMFSRFLPAVAQRVGRLVLASYPALDRLLGGIAGVSAIDAELAQLPPDAVHTSFWSLPAHLGIRLDSLPDSVPYLRLPPEGPELGPRRGLRVGLTWAGNPETTHDQDRSAPSIGVLRPLLEVPGIEWFSLQLGERAAEAEQFGIHPIPPVMDFADTAYVISQLDLVITVDTSVAHLAGALGSPTWIMVPTLPEFRWMLDREDSPWYPTARLFRRRHSNDWAGLVDRMRQALVCWMAAGSGAPRQPPAYPG